MVFTGSLRDLPIMLRSIPVAFVTVGIGLTSLLVSGYQLTYFEKNISNIDC